MHHPEISSHFLFPSGNNQNVEKKFQEADKCPVCQKTDKQAATLWNCGHSLCEACDREANLRPIDEETIKKIIPDYDLRHSIDEKCSTLEWI